MTRAPLVMAKPEQASRGNRTVWDTTLGWRFPIRGWRRCSRSSRWARRARTSPSVGRSRARIRTHSRFVRSSAGLRQDFSDELIAVNGVERDEHPRPDTTREARLAPAGVPRGGTVTAGNSSGVNDGARRSSSPPRRRHEARRRAARRAFVGSAVAGVDPRVMGIGPIPAVRKLLERSGVAVDELDLVELNEAFASQSLVVIRVGLDPRRSMSTAARSRSDTRSG